MLSITSQPEEPDGYRRLYSVDERVGLWSNADQLPVVRGGKREHGRSDCGRDGGHLHDPAADEHDKLLGTDLKQPRRRGLQYCDAEREGGPW